MLLAQSVAVVHAVAVVLMVTGALLALRWPRLLRVHAPVSLTILLVHLLGADCPLTTLELWLREQAGAASYGGGFLDHYLLAPLGLDPAAAATSAGIYAVAVLPNALGYGLHAARALRRSPDLAAA